MLSFVQGSRPVTVIKRNIDVMHMLIHIHGSGSCNGSDSASRTVEV